MLHYPKIPDTKGCPGGRCLAFEKYDGTNLHWCWDRDFGWHAFGTRRDEFHLTASGIAEFHDKHAHLRGCAELFLADFADRLEQVFLRLPKYQKYPSCKVFTEFLGPQSFAGLHKEEDEKRLVLFDVMVESFGIVSPWQFVADFGGPGSARVVYEGKFTGKLIEDVRQGKFNVREGVVCKGGTGGSDLWMAKMKTDAYREKLLVAFAQNWENYWE